MKIANWLIPALVLAASCPTLAKSAGDIDHVGPQLEQLGSSTHRWTGIAGQNLLFVSASQINMTPPALPYRIFKLHLKDAK